MDVTFQSLESNGLNLAFWPTANTPDSSGNNNSASWESLLACSRTICMALYEMGATKCSGLLKPESSEFTATQQTKQSICFSFRLQAQKQN